MSDRTAEIIGYLIALAFAVVLGVVIIFVVGSTIETIAAYKEEAARSVQ